MNDLRVGSFSFSEIFEPPGYKPPAMLRKSTVQVKTSRLSESQAKKVDEAAQKALEPAKVIGQTDPAPFNPVEVSMKPLPFEKPLSRAITPSKTQPVFIDSNKKMRKRQEILESENRIFAFEDEEELGGVRQQ